MIEKVLNVYNILIKIKQNIQYLHTAYNCVGKLVSGKKVKIKYQGDRQT